MCACKAAAEGGIEESERTVLMTASGSEGVIEAVPPSEVVTPLARNRKNKSETRKAKEKQAYQK